MKKLFSFLVLVIFCLSINAQTVFPINGTLGSPKSTVLTKGVSAADSGYQYRTNFQDTGSANNGELKNVPGVVIRVRSDLWMRDEYALSWIKIGSNASVIDTTSLSDRINLKLNIADTGLAFTPYVRTPGGTAGLIPRWIDSRTMGNSSILYDNGTNAGATATFLAPAMKSATSTHYYSFRVDGNLGMGEVFSDGSYIQRMILAGYHYIQSVNPPANGLFLGVYPGQSYINFKNNGRMSFDTLGDVAQRFYFKGSGRFTDSLFGLTLANLADSSDVVATTKWIKQQNYGAGFISNYPTSVSYNQATQTLSIARNLTSDITTTLPEVTTSLAGLQSAADKAFIDSIRAGQITDSVYYRLIVGPTTHDSAYVYVNTYNNVLDSALMFLIPKSGGSSTDTVSLSNRINLKLNISDTATMLSVYTRVQRFLDSLSAHTTRFNGVTSSLATKLNITDTANIKPRLYAGSNITITGTYPNLTIAASGSVSGGIANVGTSDYGLITQNDSTYKVDTALLSTKLWRQKGIDSLQGNINLKFNTSDTANKWVTSIYRKTGSDSVFYVKGGVATFAYKDSIGTGGGGSTTYKIGTYNAYSSVSGASIVADSIYMQAFSAESPGLVPPGGGSPGQTLRGNATWGYAPTVYKVTSDVTSPASTAYSDITGLSFTATSGVTYVIDAVISVKVDATTTGAKFAINGPASPTFVSTSYFYPTTSSALGINNHSTYDAASATTGTATLSAPLWFRATIKTSSTGTVALRFGSELSTASSVTINAGSYMSVMSSN